MQNKRHSLYTILIAVVIFGILLGTAIAKSCGRQIYSFSWLALLCHRATTPFEDAFLPLSALLLLWYTGYTRFASCSALSLTFFQSLWFGYCLLAYSCGTNALQMTVFALHILCALLRLCLFIPVCAITVLHAHQFQCGLLDRAVCARLARRSFGMFFAILITIGSEYALIRLLTGISCGI